MFATIAKAATAATCGLLMAATPMLAGPAQAKVASNGTQAAYTYEWNEAVKSGAPLYYHGYYCNGTTGATACFDPDGDVIYVKDIKADGYSAVMRWYTDYGRWGTCRNANGAGTWAKCNKDFAEGHTITWRATQYNGDTKKWVNPESNDFSMNTSG